MLLGARKNWSCLSVRREAPGRHEFVTGVGSALSAKWIRCATLVRHRPATASDDKVLQWARENQAVVFTHDLDFGILLARTESAGPSGIQVRTQEVTLRHLGNLVLSVLSAHGTALADGALITVDETRARVRILPIRRRSNTVG